MIGAALLMLLVSSCRETNDVLLPYDHNDKLAFGAAEYSFAGKFKVTWNGLNQYYALKCMCISERNQECSFLCCRRICHVQNMLSRL